MLNTYNMRIHKTFEMMIISSDRIDLSSENDTTISKHETTDRYNDSSEISTIDMEPNSEHNELFEEDSNEQTIDVQVSSNSEMITDQFDGM
jgi:hypothetical protein